MNKSNLGHIQFNIAQKNLPFYKDLLNLLGWSVISESLNVLGMRAERGENLWFTCETKDWKNDHDGPGMNHLAFLVPEQNDVDEMAAYMNIQGIDPLFETPRHRPEFSSDSIHTYYQVMFESPDGILFEVVYKGIKNKQLFFLQCIYMG